MEMPRYSTEKAVELSNAIDAIFKDDWMGAELHILAVILALGEMHPDSIFSSVAFNIQREAFDAMHKDSTHFH